MPSLPPVITERPSGEYAQAITWPEATCAINRG